MPLHEVVIRDVSDDEGWGAGGGANSISKNERSSSFVFVLGITVIFLFLIVVEDKETIPTVLIMKNILACAVGIY